MFATYRHMFRTKIFGSFWHVSSSDDEIDILLHGTPEQKRRLCHSSPGQRQTNVKNDEEDEWEREMNAELNGTVREIERRRGSVSGMSNVTCCKHTVVGTGRA